MCTSFLIMPTSFFFFLALEQKPSLAYSDAEVFLKHTKKMVEPFLWRSDLHHAENVTENLATLELGTVFDRPAERLSGLRRDSAPRS
jgi:hypothetical protein